MACSAALPMIGMTISPRKVSESQLLLLRSGRSTACTRISDSTATPTVAKREHADRHAATLHRRPFDGMGLAGEAAGCGS